jgi:hypothetical protein
MRLERVEASGWTTHRPASPDGRARPADLTAGSTNLICGPEDLPKSWRASQHITCGAS